MNILVIPNRGRSFNAVRPEAECYLSIAKAGHKVTLMTVPTNAYLEEYQKSGINLIMLKSAKKHNWAVIKQIHQYIKTNDIDVVYATESNGIPNAAFACIGTKAKMIAYRGTMGGMYKTDPTNYLCTLHPRINGYVCVTDSCKNNVVEKVRASIKDKCKTIYKGHDLSWYQSPATSRQSLRLKAEDFVVLCIGSAREHKGMTYMIDAMSHLKDLKRIKLVLVGDGFNCEPFQTQIQNTSMSDNIIQTGFRNDVPQLAAASDILVLPSLREGLSRVVLESLAVGTPVITSNCGGPTEVITNDVNGYIVPLKDSKAIADKISILYNNPEKLEVLKSNATNIIENELSHKRTVDNMISFFKEIVGTVD